MAEGGSYRNASTSLSDTLHYQKNSKLSFDARLDFLYPMVDETAEPLPRDLSMTEKSSLTIVRDHFRIEYSSRHHSEQMNTTYGSMDNACVRADNPIPLTAGIYYFEIKVLSKGEMGRPYIGLTSSHSNLHRAPGWDRDTYGYHGDDGKCFAAQNTGDRYGPTFSTNDVVGCGVNFENQTCFFTKNGINLGIAFRDMPTSDLYPTVGVGSRSESLEVNFGQNPFVYNIAMEQVLHESHVNDLKCGAKQKSIKTGRRYRTYTENIEMQAINL